MFDLIPIFGMVTGIVVTGMVGVTLVKVFNGPVGQALARRLHKAEHVEPGEVDALHERVELLEHRLEETEERLQFAERLLASGREAVPGESDV